MHAGIVPVTRTGDFSDVTVVDADGRQIPWPEVSHFDGEAMRDLMRDIVDRLYVFEVMGGNSDFQYVIERWIPTALGSDAPKLDEGAMKAIEACRSRRRGEGK